MPTTLIPPGIQPRRPGPHDHLGENDNGNGRRPPNDKRTGGNGDGDNWHDRPQGRRGPRERLSQARIGLFFALGGDLMFFVALISVFFVNKVSGHFDAYNRYVNEWLPITIPSILWLNTAVLLLSSLTGEFARRSMFREADIMDEWIGLGRPITRRATGWISGTLVLGTMFLAGQYIAWKQLAQQRVFFHTNPSSHYFYLITVTHAAHLFLGITALVWALTKLQRGRSLEGKQVWVDASIWYWHVMGVLWLFLFGLLEFFQ